MLKHTSPWGHFMFTISTVSPPHLHLRKSPRLSCHPRSIPFRRPWTWDLEQYINNGPFNQSEVKSHGVNNHKSRVRSTPFWESDLESRGVNNIIPYQVQGRNHADRGDRVNAVKSVGHIVPLFMNDQYLVRTVI